MRMTVSSHSVRGQLKVRCRKLASRKQWPAMGRSVDWLRMGEDGS